MAREKPRLRGCGPGTGAVVTSRPIGAVDGAGTLLNPGPPFPMATPSF